MLQTTTIAHLTDVHLGPVAGLHPRYWNMKRAFGLANWIRHRQHTHDRGVLERIVADLKTEAPDHIVVTGDLTNLGLPWEHQQALVWLSHLGGADEVSVIPGNHDIYTRIGRDEGVGRWQPHMHSNAEGAQFAPVDWAFPYVRILDRVALIGLNSAIETPPFVAAGQLGATQLARTETVLKALQAQGVFRLLMIHHPPLPGQAAPLRALRDAARLRRVLLEAGAELVIHGHNHVAQTHWLREGPRAIPIMAGASASLATAHKLETLARYNIYRISGPPWHVDVVSRGLAQPHGSVQQVMHQVLG